MFYALAFKHCVFRDFDTKESDPFFMFDNALDSRNMKHCITIYKAWYRYFVHSLLILVLIVKVLCNTYISK